MGVFVTVERERRAARRAADEAGRVQVVATAWDRVLLWSAEEILNAPGGPPLPSLADPRSGRAMQGGLALG